MNNIKIKSYSLKKKTNSGKEKNYKIKTENQNFQFSDRKIEIEDKDFKDKPMMSTVSNSLIDHVNNLIKSPGLKFSTNQEKAEAKNYKTFSLNSIEKQLKNSINSSNGNNLSNETKTNILHKNSMNSRNNQNEPSHENNNCNVIGEKERLNIKLNINSEVINNNIKINSKNFKDEKILEDLDPNNGKNDNSTSINKLKSTLEFYIQLVASKDKQIEKLKADLNKIKSYIKQNKYNLKQSNLNYLSAFTNPIATNTNVTNNTIFFKSKEKLIEESNSIINSARFDPEFKNKLTSEKHQKPEFYSDRIVQNDSKVIKGLNINNENYKSVSNNNSTTNIIGDNKSISKGKNIHFSTPNCFRKSNTKALIINNPKVLTSINISDNNNINLNNFFKGFTLNSNSVAFKTKEKEGKWELSSDKKSYSSFNMPLTKSKSPKQKEFKAVEELVKITIQKIKESEMKAKSNASTSTTQAISKENFKFPNSSISNLIHFNLGEKNNGGNNDVINNDQNGNIMVKLTQIKKRINNVLKTYSEYAVKKIVEK